MIESVETSLLLSTGTLAIVHTLFGIDHSLPFVALARAKGWSLERAIVVTVLCGTGHVASSVAIGALGAIAGVALDSLVWIEGVRGELAAALLIGFGLAYAARAGWRSLRGASHSHLYTGPKHALDGGRARHADPPVPRNFAPWALFVVFVLGPCEPLIPLMVVPAMDQSWNLLITVVVVFGTLTVGTMVVTVTMGYCGLRRFDNLEITRHADVLAGLVIAASGAAVLVLGL